MRQYFAGKGQTGLNLSTLKTKIRAIFNKRLSEAVPTPKRFKCPVKESEFIDSHIQQFGQLF